MKQQIAGAVLLTIALLCTARGGWQAGQGRPDMSMKWWGLAIAALGVKWYMLP